MKAGMKEHRTEHGTERGAEIRCKVRPKMNAHAHIVKEHMVVGSLVPRLLPMLSLGTRLVVGATIDNYICAATAKSTR